MLGIKIKNKALRIVLTTFLAVMVFLLFYLIPGGIGSDKNKVEIAQDVVVTDGVTTAGDETTLTVEKDGKYQVFAKWNPEGDVGVLTGVAVIDNAGEVVFASTGDKAEVESDPIDLRAGEYTVVIDYMTSEDEFEAFAQKYSIGEVLGNKFDNFHDGIFNYSVSVEIRQIGASNVAPVIIVATIVGLLVAALICLVSKDEGIVNEYDERQELVRAKAYKTAFFTLLIYNVIVMVAYASGLNIPAEPVVVNSLGVLIAIGTFATVSIFGDGYFALNENRKKMIILLATVGAANVVIGVMNLIDGRSFVDGKLTLQSVNLFVGLLFVCVFVILLVKGIMDKKED